MKRFDEWYGPYPYAQITVVDPPHGARRSRRHGVSDVHYRRHHLVGPKGQYLFPEVVTEHEFGHQYWYGMVATNEFENAWLDEGINSYTEAQGDGRHLQPRHQHLEFPGRPAGRAGLAA